jgi:type IV pilus assembly protein PilY1
MVTSSGTTRTATNHAVDFTSGRGWYIDWPDTGERVNIDGQLVQGTLLVATIVPSNTACSPGGYGWMNYLNYGTGASVDNLVTTAVSGRYNKTIVGFNVLYGSDSGGVSGGGSGSGSDSVGTPVLIVASSDAQYLRDLSAKFINLSTLFQGTRVLWRELVP